MSFATLRRRPFRGYDRERRRVQKKIPLNAAQRRARRRPPSLTRGGAGRLFRADDVHLPGRAAPGAGDPLAGVVRRQEAAPRDGSGAGPRAHPASRQGSRLSPGPRGKGDTRLALGGAPGAVAARPLDRRRPHGGCRGGLRPGAPAFRDEGRRGRDMPGLSHPLADRGHGRLRGADPGPRDRCLRGVPRVVRCEPVDGGDHGGPEDASGLPDGDALARERPRPLPGRHLDAQPSPAWADRSFAFRATEGLQGRERGPSALNLRRDIVRIIIGIVINAIALLATQIVPGISFHGDLLTLIVAGAILGLFNLIVRPIALLLSLPVLILSLGLFYFILNGILLWIASYFIPGYHVSGIIAGILGSLVMTIVNWILHGLFAAK